MYLSVMRVFRHVLNTILSKEQKTAQYEIYHNWRIYTLTIYMIKIRMMTLRRRRCKKNFLFTKQTIYRGIEVSFVRFRTKWIFGFENAFGSRIVPFRSSPILCKEFGTKVWNWPWDSK